MLGDLGNWGSGGTPSKSRFDYYENGSIPWLVIGDLNDGVVSGASVSITKAGLESCSAKVVKPGTILVAMYGSIGKVGVSSIDCATNQAIAHFTPDLRLLLPQYAFHALRESRQKLVKLGQGGAQQNISQGILKGFKILVAPIVEQRRIADKLDKLLARLNASRSRLDRAAAQIRQFRQSVLAEAIAGYNDATSSNASFWISCKIGDLLVDVRYGTSKRCDYGGGAHPVIRIPNVSAGVISKSDMKSADFDADEVEKLSLRPGDVLVIRSNGSVELVGRSALVSADFQGYLFAGYLIRLRVDASRLLPEYLTLLLSSPQVRSVIEVAARSTSGVHNVNANELRSLSVELPPIAAQKAIAARAARLLALADSIATRIGAARRLCDRQVESLLAKAFRGELVPQDPNDEPAQAMLDRLRAAASPPGAPPKPRSRRAALA